MDKSEKAPDKPARFCLQFNLEDPVQRGAYEVIAGKGRKKSEYIARAVKFYEDSGGDLADLVGPYAEYTMRDMIRTMVREVIEERDEDRLRGEENDLADSFLEGLEYFNQN